MRGLGLLIREQTKNLQSAISERSEMHRRGRLGLPPRVLQTCEDDVRAGVGSCSNLV